MQDSSERTGSRPLKAISKHARLRKVLARHIERCLGFPMVPRLQAEQKRARQMFAARITSPSVAPENQYRRWRPFSRVQSSAGG